MKLSHVQLFTSTPLPYMAAHNDLGRQGEDLAAEMLLKKGYKLLERNWRVNGWEVDIIARTRTEIVFVEVKTRSDDSLMLPEEAVDFNRRCRLTSAASAYINYHKITLTPRFDVVAIVLNSTRRDIRHIEDAFYPVTRRRRY